jgi:hypothetical protein
MAHRHPIRCSYHTLYAVNLVASGHSCAANSGLPLQYQQQPGESYSGSCIAKGWQNYITVFCKRKLISLYRPAHTQLF